MSKRRKNNAGTGVDPTEVDQSVVDLPHLAAAASVGEVLPGGNSFRLRLTKEESINVEAEDQPEEDEDEAKDEDDDEYMPAARSKADADDVDFELDTSTATRAPAAKSSRKRGAPSKRRAPVKPEQPDDEDDEDVYVDVLDDTEDKQGSTLATHDYSNLPLKADHATRPIWVCADGRVFLETYNALYRQAYGQQRREGLLGRQPASSYNVAMRLGSSSCLSLFSLSLCAVRVQTS